MSVGTPAGKRGRQPVKPAWERLAINFLHTYLLSPLTAAEYPIDVSGGITAWEMLGNGPDPTLTVNGGQPVGDCTFAARQHLRMAKAAAAGVTETWESSNDLVSEYLAYDHGVDRGANIAEVLSYWFLTGRIRAFAPVDHRDPEACDAIMSTFHGLYVGVDLTDAADDQFNAGEAWTVAGGERPDPADGHCIVKVMADGQEFDTWVTWGALQRSSRNWTAACTQEVWAIITTEDEMAKVDMPALVGDISAAIAAAPGSIGAPGGGPSNHAATAFSLGWQMARLYRPCDQAAIPSKIDRLPAIPEYDSGARFDLDVDELRALLLRSGLAQPASDGPPETWTTRDNEQRRNALVPLNYRILDTLACDDQGKAAAYQLGVALADACWLPDTDHPLPPDTRRSDVLFDQFGRDRMAILQGWLAEVTPLAPQGTSTVSRSLQNWADWVDANAKMLHDDWSSCEKPVVAALRNQSVGWHGLLSNPSDGGGNPPIGAWMHAGEAIVRSARATLVHVLRWFWPVLVVILAAVGGLLYLALNDPSGTQHVWAALVTVAGGLAAAGAGLQTAANKVAGGLEQTVSDSAKLDAQAWAVTWLPDIRLGPVTRHRLRKSGVGLPVGGTRVERLRAAD